MSEKPTEKTYTDSALSDMIKEFLQSFKQDKKHAYVKAIDSMMPKNRTWLTVKYVDFAGEELEEIFNKNPKRVLKIFSRAIKETLQTRFPDFAQSIEDKIRVRVSNYPQIISTRAINEDHIDRFISVFGFITQTGKPIYVPTKIQYTCYAGHKIIVDSEFGIPNLQHLKCNELQGEKRCSQDYEFEKPLSLIPLENISVQDLPSVLPPGEIPGQSSVMVAGSLIKECRPGDKVIISGVLEKYLINPRSKLLQYKLILHANHVKKIAEEEIDIKEKSNHELIRITKIPEAQRYQMLIKSIAPHIYGHDTVKEALLLLLAAHAPKNITDFAKIVWDGGADNNDEYDMIKQRWDINIFLVGDPGAAKSELLKFVAKVAPRGIYTTGGGSTAVGLTAALIKDPMTNEYKIAAGAFVLADLGVLAIDEFDKMKDEDRGKCHETMENQSFHKDTKMLFSNGIETEIGPIVDYLIENNPKTIRGKNCEILNLDEKHPLKLITTNFEKTYEINANQISRHKAPNKLIKIDLTNGRTLRVTPEHPFWIHENFDFVTVNASSLNVGDFLPVPRKISFPRNSQLSKQPSIIQTSSTFSRFLGYLITDGGFEMNRGKKNGINFSNMNHDLTDDFEKIIKELFSVNPYIRKRNDGLVEVRVISMPVLNFVKQIDPYLIETKLMRKIPDSIMNFDDCFIVDMLKVMFECDGFATKRKVGFVSINKNLICQIQTLLLRFNIQSNFFYEKLKSEKDFYRLNITGIEYLKKFYDKIGFISQRKNNILKNQLEGAYRVFLNDIIPNIGSNVSELSRNIKLHETSVLGRSITEFRYKSNFSRRSLQKFVIAFEKKIFQIQEKSNKIKDCKQLSELIEIRQSLNISQNDIAKQLKVNTATISYWEVNKINFEKYRTGLTSKLNSMKSRISDVKKLRKLCFGEIGWGKIKSIQIIDCDDDWVYDIGVPSTKTFISECVVLHNSATIAKGGVYAQLNARCSTLAAANPKHGKYDPFSTVYENTKLPIALLTRFDLIFKVRDIPDIKKDTLVAERILDTNTNLKKITSNTIAPKILTKYLSYTKQFHPTPTNEAKKIMIEYYVKMRSKSSNDGEEEDFTITARQFEAILRLATARASILSKENVDEDDVKRVIEIMNEMFQDTATDPVTGKVDLSIIHTGRTKSDNSKIILFENIVKGLVGDSYGIGPEMQEIIDDMINTGRWDDETSAKKFFKKILKEKNLIYESSPNHYKLFN